MILGVCLTLSISNLEPMHHALHAMLQALLPLPAPCYYFYAIKYHCRFRLSHYLVNPDNHIEIVKINIHSL